tara:strand:- start:70 stop:735 length:666 start_codon:yes stop_codon:yes gene_type:complete
MFALREVLAHDGKKIADQRVAIQGFGNVGSWGARLMHAEGAKIVAVSDVHGAIHNPDGIDIPALMEFVSEKKTVVGFAGANAMDNSQLLTVDCDVLMPAAIGHVLTESNARDVKAKYILEGANGPTTVEADAIFNERGITTIPDIYANAGGVTVSYFEWTQNTQQLRWSEEQVNTRLDQHMVAGHKAIRETMEAHDIPMRQAAFVTAVKRVLAGTEARGLQ